MSRLVKDGKTPSSLLRLLKDHSFQLDICTKCKVVKDLNGTLTEEEALSKKLAAYFHHIMESTNLKFVEMY